MRKKLKVYSGNYDGRFGRCVATTSKAKAARLIGVSIHIFNSFFCETGYKPKLEKCLANPEVVFKYPLSGNGFNFFLEPV